MTNILEYILENYIWFLSGAIVILLAIIGSYAEKTNFGQGKKTNLDEIKPINNFDEMKKDAKVNKPQISINNSILGQSEDTSHDDISKKDISYDNNVNEEDKTLINLNTTETEKNFSGNNDTNIEGQTIEAIIPDNLTNNIIPELKNEDSSETITPDKQEELNSLNTEFSKIIPDRPIISDDLISDIDDMSVNIESKTSDIKIPDLGDIDIPKIKPLSPNEDDIWKF